MKRTNLIIIGIIVIVVVLISYTLYSNKRKINQKSTSEVTTKVLEIPVVVGTAEFYSSPNSLKKTGNIAPFKQAIVYASSAGNIQTLQFDLGSNVTAGQLMAITDPGKINIDLQNAVSKEKKLQNDLSTYVELLEGKATTQEKVNELRLDYTDARNQTAQIRKQLGDTRILAPISGVVTAKSVERGVYVSGGTEMATIVDLKKVKVQVYLTESESYNVKLGDFANITNEVFPDRIFKGKITYISPQGDATHSYLTEMTVINPDNNLLKSGAFVYAEFTNNNVSPALVIPREALLENTQIPTVYTVKGNKVFTRTIRIGNDFGDKVEVLSGLSSGESVVISGQINLKNQSLIKITNNKSK